MQIERTYYGLKEVEFTFTAQEVKKALLEYLASRNDLSLPDKMDACEIEIYEEQSDYEEIGKGEKAKVVLTVRNKDIETKGSESA